MEDIFVGLFGLIICIGGLIFTIIGVIYVVIVAVNKSDSSKTTKQGKYSLSKQKEIK